MRGGPLVLLSLFTLAAAPATAEDLVVIVNSDRDVELTRADVAQIYLKLRRFWDDGEAIVPINRDSGSRARSDFVRLIFGSEARKLPVHWNRAYFRGVLPPATLASDEAVKRFVARERLAIGYVAASLVDATVKVVLRLERP